MALTGLLFNIQKFSLHDGPGIRTVVFFKGCPLSCKWCSNPESQRAEPCMMGETPDSRPYSIEETVDVCLQDRPFYEESGGGVTLSGGEALTQGKFAAALLEALGKEGIHRAIETSGYARPEVFEKVFAGVDLILFDIKHHDDRRHEEGTGVHNGPILENLQKALERGKVVLPRIPVIPGYNDSLADAEGFSRLIRAVGLGKAQLLPFHQFGEKKYEKLNWEYALRGMPQIHKEDLADYRQVFIDHGVDCFF
ncbi:MAG: glycyl-radical enzyme activating protein [Treponema sp.]|jgi:pyruvate formate lyase activating enzyme|nr:glycyl-radical enzyme activating protein [Treponema sp.]